MNGFRKLILLSFFLIGLLNPAFNQSVKSLRGKVLNQKGEGVAYVSISLLPSNKLAYSNLDGSFEIQLASGKQTLVVHSIDYLTQKISVDSSTNYLELILKEQDYQLPELQVKANKVNPAVYIMRKAISMAPYYRNQVKAYNAKVYLKGSGKLENIPFLLKPILKNQGYEEGKLMVSESVNELSYQAPNTYKERVVSMRSSFKLPDGPQPLSMVRGNWYNASSTGLVSPLSVQAFSVYDFVLEGSFFEDGNEINKIKVIPKRAGRDLYKGTIYIIENRWSIHSLDLSYEGNGVQVAMKTRFEPLADYPEIWMPATYNIKIRGQFVGVSGYFHYLASLRNYSIVPGSSAKTEKPLLSVQTPPKTVKPLPKARQKRQAKIQELLSKQELSKIEMLKLASAIQEEQQAETELTDIHDSSELSLDSLAFFRDSNYWNQIRPVNLMEDEQLSLDKAIPDSSKAGFSKKHPFNLQEIFLSGDSFFFKSSNLFLNVHPLVNGIYRNAPDGLGYKLHWSIGKFLNNSNKLRFTNQLNFPFQRKAFYGSLGMSYQWGKFFESGLDLELGRNCLDYASKGASRFEEFFLLSFYRQNPAWYYQSDFARIQYQTYPIRGLLAGAELSLAKRSQLPLNPYWFKWEDKEILTQNPLEPPPAANSELRQLTLFANYSPGLRYYFKSGKRYNIPGKWPQISLQFQTTLPGSTPQFNKYKIGLSQTKALRHWLTLRYQIEAGLISRGSNLFAMDRFLFAGNESWIVRTQAFSRFELLPYYKYASSTSYLQGFSSWDFKRIGILRLPGFNLSNMREQIGMRFLASANEPIYLETSWKLIRIWQFFDFGYTAAFSNFKFYGQGIRIGFDIPSYYK